MRSSGQHFKPDRAASILDWAVLKLSGAVSFFDGRSSVSSLEPDRAVSSQDGAVSHLDGSVSTLRPWAISTQTGGLRQARPVREAKGPLCLHRPHSNRPCMPRSYQHEHTRSRPISEVKHVWARLGTTLRNHDGNALVLWCFAFARLNPSETGGQGPPRSILPFSPTRCYRAGPPSTCAFGWTRRARPAKSNPRGKDFSTQAAR